MLSTLCELLTKGRHDYRSQRNRDRAVSNKQWSPLEKYY